MNTISLTAMYRPDQDFPFAPGAWYDPASVKTGYEIIFTRYFTKPDPVPTTEDVHSDILTSQTKTGEILSSITEPSAS